jgi:hypothetical protein
VNSSAFHAGQLPVLLRGEALPIQGWMREWSFARLGFHVLVIVLGTAAFGAAIGCWRAPMQALFTATKFPLIVLLTAFGNGLLNGMLAPLLGVNLTLRQSLLAVLLSFTIAAAILGAFSPLMFFLVWNSPPLTQVDESARTTHSVILLALVTMLALAGIAGNVRLLQLLRELGSRNGERGIRNAEFRMRNQEVVPHSAFTLSRAANARRTVFAWLAGNLLLGSQLAWILRPFVGHPGLPVQFLRGDAFHGNFFESVFHTVQQLIN